MSYSNYPYTSGDVTALGPECFADGTLICYKGENYTRQTSAEAGDGRDELAQLIGRKLDGMFGTRDFGPATQDYLLADELISNGYKKAESQ